MPPKPGRQGDQAKSPMEEKSGERGKLGNYWWKLIRGRPRPTRDRWPQATAVPLRKCEIKLCHGAGSITSRVAATRMSVGDQELLLEIRRRGYEAARGQRTD